MDFHIKNSGALSLAVLAVLICWSALPAFAGKQKINWAAINPELKNSPFIENTSECLFCHGEYVKAFEKTKHAKAFRVTWGEDVGKACQNCHGPLGKHLAEPGMKLGTNKMVRFSLISAKAKNAICLQCHENGARMQWRGSKHELMNMSCPDCHYVMRKKSDRHMFVQENPNQVCFQCHRVQRALIERASHMPIREGKMDCAKCHNPHGGPGPSLLKKPTVNRTCYQCHREKRGPLLWEHAPVRENCVNCHNPHGSNLGSLLNRRLPYLCQQCHMNVGHSSSLRARDDLTGAFLGGKSCINCHSRIHGSNHPSGARFQR